MKKKLQKKMMALFNENHQVFFSTLVGALLLGNRVSSHAVNCYAVSNESCIGLD